MNILVIGPPGSGKTTQAELLEKELGLPHLSTGELLHFLSQEKSPRGQKIKKIIESGGLVNDQLVLSLVEKRLKEKQYQKGFILDGAPRSLWQAKNFKIKFDKVFYLKVSDQENIKRLLKRGRSDTDRLKVIKKRLELYHQETEPMLDYYQKMAILEEVDGEQSIEVIFQDISQRLK